MQAPHRRRFLTLLLAGLGATALAGCGQRGPLYLPPEEEQKKKKDPEKTSRLRPAVRRG